MANDYAGCRRYQQTSGVGAINNLSTDLLKPAKLRMVTVAYNGASSNSVTVTLVSGAGAAYNVVLNTITLTNNQGTFIPTMPIPFNADDVITVSAPLQATFTSSVTIYVDRSVMD